MPKRKIDKTKDAQILIELAQGNKTLSTIAKEYNVSVSYISSLKRGKKKPEIVLINKIIKGEKELEINSDNLDVLADMLRTKKIIVDKESIKEYLYNKYRNHLVKAQLYQELLSKYRED